MRSPHAPSNVSRPPKPCHDAPVHERSRLAVLAAVIAGCEPLVEPPATSTTGEIPEPSSGSAGGQPNPDDPDTAATTAPPPTTDPDTCMLGTAQPCICPDGTPGTQRCATTSWGPCECDGLGTSSGAASGGLGSSSGWGSSGGTDPAIPDLPPGETCLPLDIPCTGTFELWSDAELETVSTCSRTTGDFAFGMAVTSLEPLACLREVEGAFALYQSELVELSGLSLQSAGMFSVVQNPALLYVEAPNLESAHRSGSATTRTSTPSSFPG